MAALAQVEFTDMRRSFFGFPTIPHVTSLRVHLPLVL